MRPHPIILSPLLFGCTAQYYVDEADDQVYGILERASKHVTGDQKTFRIGRIEGTLREQLLTGGGTVKLGLIDALDVAAENARNFQTQKESLYQTALALTSVQNDFAIQFGGGGAANPDGVGRNDSNLLLTNDLSTSVNTLSGGRIALSFMQSFLRSLTSSGSLDPTSILSLTLTQPLLRGFGPRIAREPLNQAERDVVYEVRDFERFRRGFAVQVISAYYGVAQEMRNLDNIRANLESVTKSREQIEALQAAGRRSRNDTDRAIQQELNAQNAVLNAENRLQTTTDRFKFTLGLPVDAQVVFDEFELDRITEAGLVEVEIDEADAIDIALARRYDYQTALDQVEDAARRVLVAENALRSQLDFSAAFTVPNEDGKPFKMDWSRVDWAAGFDIDLALNRLDERNGYRRSLIALDQAMRAREQLEDDIKSQIRLALRNIQTRRENYEIELLGVQLAQTRVESTTLLYQAGRPGGTALDILDATNDLLTAQLGLTGAVVDYTVARLELLRDLEALALTPKGLRVDLDLVLPEMPDTPTPVGPGGR